MDVNGQEQTREEGQRAIDSLSPIKHKALLSLLEIPHVGKAAKAAGVGKSTLHMWLQKDADFRKAYLETRREINTLHTARLQAGVSTAVDTLIEIADDKNQHGANRVGAAKAILEHNNRSIEKENFAARLEQMEALEAEAGEGD